MNDDIAAKTPWYARVAHVAFWFFLLKGLLWLTVPLAVAWFGWQVGAS